MAVVPANMKAQSTERQLLEIFEAVDIDGSGAISMHEYFLWTLSIASEQEGSMNLKEVFCKYDKNGEGYLDAAQFIVACEDMGFGPLGHDLFLELDQDESGTVAYAELVQMLSSQTMSVGRDCKRFLTSMAYESANSAVMLDTSGWNLDATTDEGLRGQLQNALLNASARVSDLYNYMTAQGHLELRKSQFLSSMINMGYAGKTDLITAAFDKMDTNATGELSMDEVRCDLFTMVECQIRRDVATPTSR